MANGVVKIEFIGDATSAQRALQQFNSSASAAEGQAARSAGGIRNSFGGLKSSLLSSGLGESFAPAMMAMDGLANAAPERGKRTASGFMIGMGVGAAALGGIGLKLAEPLEKAEATLKVAVQNTGGDFEAFKNQFDDVVKHEEKFGHTSADTTEALAKLTTATKDPKEAIKEMGVVSDVAAYKHISLAAAADMVARVHGGGAGKILKQFGIDTASVGAASKTAAADEKDLGKALDARMKAQDNLAAAQRTLQELEAADHAKKTLSVEDHMKLEDAQKRVANATTNLKDANDKVAGAQANVNKSNADAAQSHGKVSDALSLVEQRIHGVAAAQADTFGGKLDAAKAKVIDFAAKAGEHFGKILIAAGPAMAGVGGLIQSGIIGKMGEGIKLLGSGAVGFAKMAASAISAGAEMAIAGVEAMLPWLPLIATIAVIAAGAYLIIDNWGAISDFFKGIGGAIFDTLSGVWNWVKDHWPLLASIIFPPFAIGKLIFDHWNDILNFFTGLPKWFADLFLDIGKGIANGYIWGINEVISGWDWLMDHLKIPGFDIGPVHFGGLDIGSSLKIDKLPYLHGGGIVPGPFGADVLAVLQAGEHVTSVSDTQRGGGGTPSIGQIGPFHGYSVQDARKVASIVLDELAKHDRRNGNVGVRGR